VKIEEKINSFFILDWKKDPNTLVHTDTKIKISYPEITACPIKKYGKTFCHEDKIKKSCQSNSGDRLINHKWNGGTPNFHNKLNVHKYKKKNECSLNMFKKRILLKKMIEANAWVKKYFILRAFGLKNDALNLNNGKNIKKLISIMAHDSVILLIETPNNVDKINKKKKLFFCIKQLFSSFT